MVDWRQERGRAYGFWSSGMASSGERYWPQSRGRELERAGLTSRINDWHLLVHRDFERTVVDPSITLYHNRLIQRSSVFHALPRCSQFQSPVQALHMYPAVAWRCASKTFLTSSSPFIKYSSINPSKSQATSVSELKASEMKRVRSGETRHLRPATSLRR